MVAKSNENETQKRYSKPRFQLSFRALLLIVLFVAVYCAGWASHKLYGTISYEIEQEKRFQQMVEQIRKQRGTRPAKTTPLNTPPLNSPPSNDSAVE